MGVLAIWVSKGPPPEPSSSTLLQQNKSINIIYMSSNPTTGQMFTSVLNAQRGPGEGPGFNPLWPEVDVIFSNPTFAPQQFTSDNASRVRLRRTRRLPAALFALEGLG